MKERLGNAWGLVAFAWPQAMIPVSTIQLLMNATTVYAVAVYPKFHVPFWSYVVILSLFGLSTIVFVLTIGMKGYAKFFSTQTRIEAIERKQDLIMKHFGIEDIDDSKVDVSCRSESRSLEAYSKD